MSFGAFRKYLYINMKIQTDLVNKLIIYEQLIKFKTKVLFDRFIMSIRNIFIETEN